MEIRSAIIERIQIEKSYSVVVKTTVGDITMYGEVLNGQVNEDITGPAFWNKDKFKSLPLDEQQLAISTVNEHLQNCKIK